MVNISNDIRQEELIHKTWNFKDNVLSNYQNGILITGANSFVGCHVLDVLQHEWNGNIHLLIRAESKLSAIQKMTTAFARWKLSAFNSERFVMHRGDVFCGNMGLETEEYIELKQDTGMVLHLAMNPQYHIPYNRFKQKWLPELERMIQFCGDENYPKRLHYPSSYNANFFTEEHDYAQLNTNAWQSGYAGFKWVATKAIQNAFRQNLRGCVYDIPLVVGSKKHGLCPENYSIWHILGMFKEAGYYIDFEFNIVPVDVLAQVIVTNLIDDSKKMGTSFIRPVLKEAINQKYINKAIAFILGLKHANRAVLIAACPQKRKCNFMIPEEFYTLLSKVNALKAVWPHSFNSSDLPSSKLVFQSNMKSILTKFQQIKTL